MAYTLAQIAHIETDFSEKFGIPRQSGLVEELRARIVFEPEFRSPDAVRGLDGYDYIWLVWQFSTVVQAGQDGTNWRPTVRPPRLGGNTRMGVFATRSPFRPNALGLSSVKLLKVEPNTPQGPVLTVGGADLLDGTPIFDIKPYLPYVDAHPDARGGFYRHHKVLYAAGTGGTGSAGTDPGGQAGCPTRRAPQRPPPQLPARPRTPVRSELWRCGGKV